MTPAAVSYQIKALEDRVGRQLFIRRNRAVSLSPAGVKLASPLTDLFAQIAGALVEVSARGAVASLEVTAISSFATKWLAPRLAHFSLAHPDCRVRVVASDELVDFRRSTADVGLRYGRGEYEGVHAERLMSVAAFPVCSRAFMREHSSRLRAPADLLRLPLLHDESSLLAPGLPGWRLWLERAGVHRPDPRQGIVFESAHMAIDAALAGTGVALALAPLVEEDLKARRLVRLFQVAVPSTFSLWFVCGRNRIRDPRVAQFRDWLLTQVRHRHMEAL